MQPKRDIKLVFNKDWSPLDKAKYYLDKAEEMLALYDDEYINDSYKHCLISSWFLSEYCDQYEDEI